MSAMRADRQRRFGDLSDDIAARLPDREGLVFGTNRYTFGQIAARIDDAARRLIAAGVRHGEHVALWLNNCDDWIFISFAVQKIGAVLVPINTRFRPRDLSYVLAQSDSRYLITHDHSGPVDYAGMVREAITLPASGHAVHDSRFPLLRSVILLGEAPQAGTLDWQALAEPAGRVSADHLARARAVDPAATAFIMYTSGTTGFPKGVVRTHDLIRNVEERAHRMAITYNDTILNYLPLFHALALSEAAWMSMITGARQIVTRGFDPEESLDLIEKERATVIHGFEAHVKGLSEAQEVRPRNVSSLRTGIFAAGMLSATPVVRRGMKALAPIKNVSGYGMTEIWLGVSLSSLDDDEVHRSEASGWPGIGYELRIVDDATGASLGSGVAGELQVRGWAVMKEYYKKPAMPRCGCRTAISDSSAATRTCSRSAARTSIRWRPRACCWSIPPSSRSPWSACRTSAWARSPWPTSSAARASRSRPTRCWAIAAARSQASSCRGTSSSSRRSR
jgi:fatty-acyl-CoA synthase